MVWVQQVTGDDFQIVYYDTPGVLRPDYKLQARGHGSSGGLGQDGLLASSSSSAWDGRALLLTSSSSCCSWHGVGGAGRRA